MKTTDVTYTYGVKILEKRRAEILTEFKRAKDFRPNTIHYKKTREKNQKEHDELETELGKLIKGIDAEIRVLKEFNLKMYYE